MSSTSFGWTGADGFGAGGSAASSGGFAASLPGSRVQNKSFCLAYWVLLVRPSELWTTSAPPLSSGITAGRLSIRFSE